MNARHLTAIATVAFALTACGGGGGTQVVSSVPDPTVFTFRTDAITSYAKVDRMGGPATTTALLRPGAAGGNTRQQANLTDPADDGQYAPEYINTLRTLHYKLGPQLKGLGIATCGVVPSPPPATADSTVDVSKCVNQALAMAHVIPDVLRLDTSRASVYPNGRNLEDPVVDRLLAIALLDLTDPAATCFGGTCTLNTLVGSLNPAASDPKPLTSFPYLNNVNLAPFPPAQP